MNRYWIEREALRYKQNLMKIGAYDRELDKLYRQAYMAVEKEIADFYARYAKDNNLTMAEARKRISAFDVKAYQDRVAEIMKRGNLSARAKQELRLYNATMKINRLEMLKANIGLSLIETYQSEEDAFRECLNEDAASEYRRQSGILGEMTQDMPKEMLQSVVEGSFHNATFSDRIWAHQDELRYRLESMLTNGLIQGKNPRAYISQLRKEFGVSRSNAFRLLRTEFARVQTDTQMRTFSEYGYSEYIFISNSTACRDCLELNGQHFKLTEQQIGKNAPPIHPNCMCSTAAYSGRGIADAEYQSVKTIKEANDYLKAKLGVTNAKLAGMGMEPINNINQALSNLYRKYPQLQGFIKTVKTDKNLSDNCPALFTSAIDSKGNVSTTLKINPELFKDMDAINQMIQQETASGYWSMKDGVEGLLEHELSHALEMQMTFADKKADPFSSDINSHLDRALAFNEFSRHTLANDILTKAFSKCNIDLTADNIERYISGYAKDVFENKGHYGDAFAEALSSSKKNAIIEAIIAEIEGR